jgi:short-subunit dehydrogenase
MENQTRHDNENPSIVIVTGGSKGIGKAIALKFAREGSVILLCARNEHTLKEAAEEIKLMHANAIVKTFSADLSDKTEVIAFAEWCLQQGTPSVIVNNAGNYLPGNVWNEPEGNMEDMMNTNFYSAYHLTRLLLPDMVLQGSGHIFNICSIASLHAYEGGGSYSVSKFALYGFTKNLRHELKRTGIKVTAVLPGAVMTETWGDFDNSGNRIMEAGDIAELVVAASRLSGQAVVEEILLRPQLGDL